MLKIATVKVDNYKYTEVEQGLQEAVMLIGGVASLIQPGDKVLIKPNMLEALSPEKAVTTHPEVVRAVIRMVKASDGVAFVGDSPALGGIRKVAEKTEIAEVCRQEGAAILPFDKSVVIHHPEGKFLKRFEVAQEFEQVDKVVSVAKMKTHSLMGITGGVKNLFGFIVGPNKAQFHLRVQKQRDFAAMLADLNQAIKPTLTIIDGIVGMEGNGPRNGTSLKTGVIIAGTNGFAVDMAMARTMGFSAEKLPIADWALTQGFVPEFEIVGSAKDIVVPYTAPKNLISLDAAIPSWVANLGQNQLTPRPVINESCVGCGRCAAHCPPQTIIMANGSAVIDYKKCIRCYCCQELCPHNAVDLKEGMLLRLVKGLG